MDVTLLALRPDDYKDSSMKDMADTYYTSSRFGYGAGGDGFCVVCDTETGEAEIFAYGSAADKVPEDYLEYTADHIAGYKDQYGVYGMLYAGAKFLSRIFLFSTIWTRLRPRNVLPAIPSLRKNGLPGLLSLFSLRRVWGGFISLFFRLRCFRFCC